MHCLLTIREERYFDREEVLGRDVASVFSKAARQAAAGPSSGTGDGSGAPSLTPLADAEALKQSLGARRFISETEVCKRPHYTANHTEGNSMEAVSQSVRCASCLRVMQGSSGEQRSL